MASTADDANAAGARTNVDAAAPIAVSAWRRLKPTDDGAFAASCASCARDDDDEDDDEVAIVIILCALCDRRVGARTDAGAHANEDANITTTVTL